MSPMWFRVGWILFVITALNAAASLVLLGVRIDQGDGWKALWNVGNFVFSIAVAVLVFRVLRKEARR